MKNFTHFQITFGFLFFTLLISNKVFAQPCSVRISASDSLVCAGDSITLDTHYNGPGLQLHTTTTAGNDHRGNMFDVVATNDVTILSFDAFPISNTTVEIYYKVGSWNGFANTPSAWTFVGSAPVVATGGLVSVPVNVNVTIPAGQTYAFYVTSTNTTVSLRYTNGTAVGNVYSSDANITFLEGGGMEYPFTAGSGGVFQPRVWNGNINYTLANQPGTTYTWGGGETTASISTAPTATTAYTVSSEISGCATAYDTLDITVSIPNVGIMSTDTLVCPGTEVLLYGTGAESYAWDNGVMDSVAFQVDMTKTYTVTGTDSIGCTNTNMLTITANSPAVSAGPDVTLCPGEEHTFSGTGAESYTWDNGITDGVSFLPSENGVYTVTGTDTNGCTATDEVALTIYTFTGSVSASEATLIASGYTDVSVQWINCADMTAIPGETDTLFVTQQVGSYAVIIEDNTHGCVDTSDCIQMDFVGVDDIQDDATLRVYPVPTNSTITVVSSQAVIERVELIDLMGKVLETTEPNAWQTTVDLSSYAANTFFVRVYRGDQVTLLRILKD